MFQSVSVRAARLVFLNRKPLRGLREHEFEGGTATCNLQQMRRACPHEIGYI
jgi:hypothetical protein